MPNDGIPADEKPAEFTDDAGPGAGAAGNPVARDVPGRPRKAVSAFLFDGEGHMLLRRRAASRHYSPGVWSSSGDGQPRPGEALEMAAARVAGELGVIPRDLTRAGASVYRRTDPALGLGVCVLNHVFVGRLLTEVALIRVPAWLAGLADWSEDVILAPRPAINPPGHDYPLRRTRTSA